MDVALKYGYYNMDLAMRKEVLEGVTEELIKSTNLDRESLAKLITTHGIVHEDIQVDMIIHLLDLYTAEITDEELTESTLKVLKDPELSKLLSTNSPKLPGILIGKLMSTYKKLDPKKLSQRLPGIITHIKANNDACHNS